MTLDDLATELLELRRYVRSKPDYVREQFNKPKTGGVIRCDGFGERMAELICNINVGLSRIHSNPEILRGYLYGAAQEIREHAAKAKEGGGDGR